jgi:hypothetical protein
MTHEWIGQWDIKGLAQCYDTTAGVGFSGGHKGDFNQKFNGLPWWWIVVGVVLLVIALISVPFGIRFLSNMYFRHTIVPVHRPMSAAEPFGTFAGLGHGGSTNENVQVLSTNGLSESKTLVPAVPDVFCTGYCASGGDVLVTLSDGNTYSAKDGEVSSVSRRSVCVHGRVYAVAVGHAYSSYVWASPGTELNRVSDSDGSPSSSVDVTTIGHPRDREPAAPSHFGQMQTFGR